MRKDGSRFLANVIITPVRDASGRLRGFAKVTRDVTERQRAREALGAHEERQRQFVRDVLFSATEGRLRLCDSQAELPAALSAAAGPLRLTRSSLGEFRRLVQRVALDNGFSDSRWQDLMTAVGEAGMNAVVHGGGGEGRVCVGDKGIVQVWIQDQGSGIAQDSLHLATLERGFTTGGSLGHGFSMMLKAADRIWLLTGAQGTTVVIEQDRVPPEPYWLQGFFLKEQAAVEQ